MVLTDDFTKFSQAFVTADQKVLNIAKILVNKLFYVYDIPNALTVTKAEVLINEFMEHLFAMYGLKESNTMPYNLPGKDNKSYDRDRSRDRDNRVRFYSNRSGKDPRSRSGGISTSRDKSEERRCHYCR